MALECISNSAHCNVGTCLSDPCEVSLGEAVLFDSQPMYLSTSKRSSMCSSTSQSKALYAGSIFFTMQISMGWGVLPSLALNYTMINLPDLM